MLQILAATEQLIIEGIRPAEFSFCSVSLSNASRNTDFTGPMQYKQILLLCIIGTQHRIIHFRAYPPAFVLECMPLYITC